MSDEWTNRTQASIHPARNDDGLPPLTLAAGLVAALIGGVVWAAIAIFGNLEVGWVAWGIGVAVGGAMALTTPARSRKLAVVAAMLALVGLAAGKAMTFAGSAGPIAEEIMEEDGYMQGMTAWQMYAEGVLSPDLQTAVADTEARGDTLSDALWADMLAEADGRLAAMSEEDRRALARETAGLSLEDQVDHVIHASGLVDFFRKDKGEKGDANEAVIEALKDAGITPISIGEGDKWPGMHFWNYLATRICGQAKFEAAMARTGYGPADRKRKGHPHEIHRPH